MNYLIILPTYNEINNIGGIVSQIINLKPEFNILIIDDNSPDGTGQLVDKLAQKFSRLFVIHRSGKLGLGTAYQEGFKYAVERGFDYIFTMDSDFSHKPEYLPVFAEHLQKYDLVIGSRYIPGGRVAGWPLRRIILSKYGNIYARFVAGLSIKDCTSGFTGFSKRVLEIEKISDIKSEGYGFLIEFKYHVIKKGFKYKEIPIVFNDRTVGKSKISQNIILEAITLAWKLRLGL